MNKHQATIPLWSDDPDVESVGAILGMGRNKAYELAGKGEIPGVVRLGGRYFGIRPRLMDWLEHGAEET